MPLWAIGLCGLVGVLYDADHLIAYYTSLPGRFLHLPLFIVCCTLLGGYCALVGGYLLGYILRRLKRIAIRFLTVAEIIPLKLCPRLWAWLLVKLGRI